MMNDDYVLLFIQTTYSTNDYIVDDDDYRTREYDDDYKQDDFLILRLLWPLSVGFRVSFSVVDVGL